MSLPIPGLFLRRLLDTLFGALLRGLHRWLFGSLLGRSLLRGGGSRRLLFGRRFFRGWGDARSGEGERMFDLHALNNLAAIQDIDFIVSIARQLLLEGQF